MSLKSEITDMVKTLEEKFAKLSDSHPEEVTEVVAVASSAFEKIASSYDTPVDGQTLDELAAIASAFDLSGEPELQAEAAEIDNVLFAIAEPKQALANLNLVYDKELEELRKERRAKDLEEKYTYPKEKLDEMYGHKAIADAVKDKVRRYRPMEAPLSTRYSPDRPGVSLMRITDRVYQDPSTGKIYDYAAGYTTDKGNEIPGGGVEEQVKDINENQSRSLFTTREGLLSEK